MAEWRDAWWEATLTTGLPPTDRRHGDYRQYVPDRVSERPLHVTSALAHRAAAVERAVRSLSIGPGAHGLEGLARFLLRSEAIASSLIEGIAPSPQQVALAELAHDEEVRGFNDQARLVANNITILRSAGRDLASSTEVTVRDIEALHNALLPDERHRGLRAVQNWIGGSSWHPLDAEFVPPPPDLVRPLVVDLVDYLNGSIHAPLIQAALVHAQFETIHPFTDGNGRVGRALMHTVLTRRGLTPSAVLPISLVLATLRNSYVDGLTTYRYLGRPTEAAAAAAVEGWLEVFVDAAGTAAEQARAFAAAIAQLFEDWNEQVSRWRRERGTRAAPRSDSATARLLPLLAEVPILTTRTAQRVLDVSPPVARWALYELAEAGVLTRRAVERGVTGYAAMDVFTLLTWTERRLASTRWDTREAAPNRPVPARPALAVSLPQRGIEEGLED